MLVAVGWMSPPPFGGLGGRELRQLVEVLLDSGRGRSCSISSSPTVTIGLLELVVLTRDARTGDDDCFRWRGFFLRQLLVRLREHGRASPQACRCRRSLNSAALSVVAEVSAPFVGSHRINLLKSLSFFGRSSFENRFHPW